MKKMFSKTVAMFLTGAMILSGAYITPVHAAAPEVSVISEYEALCGEWQGSGSYHAYYKANGAENYTKIDDALIRTDGKGGYRVEVLGLKGGTSYTVKIVPVSGETENEAEAFTFDGYVSAYDRSGYAFFKTTNCPGAYNMDGTLPSNADVVYVNESNKNTVTLGKRTGLNDIISGYTKGSTPLVIRVIGTLDVSNLDGLSSDRKLTINGSAAGLTIEGVGTDACVYGWGFALTSCSDVEFRNIRFSWNYDDAVEIQKSTRVWVHDNDFTVGDQTPPTEADKKHGDGSCDAKRSDYVTISYNHFIGTAKTCLLGASKSSREDVGHYSYHHNYFDGIEQRGPRVRWHDVHIYNNYYKNVGYDLDDGSKIGYGIGATCNCSIFAENNYFENTYRPMLTSDANCQALSKNDGGVIKAYGNYIDENCTGMEAKDCFFAASKDQVLTAADYTASLGGWTYDNFDTSDMFYKDNYFLESAEDCVATVTALAGRPTATSLQLTNAINGSSTGTGGTSDPGTEPGTEPTTVDPNAISMDNDYFYDFPSSGSTSGSFGGANGSGTFFTASNALNGSGTTGTVTVGGKEYTFTGVGGFANKSTITFTAEKDGTLTIVSTSGSTTARTMVVTDASGKQAARLDSGKSNEAAVVSAVLPAGKYTITNNGGGEAKLFYIGYKNADGTSTDILYGDADLSGDITAADASMVLQYTLNKGAFEIDDNFITRCNVNGDEDIDAADSSIILQKTLKGDAFTMPVEESK